MERQTEVMIALGAAIGANCIPCFDFLYGKAKETGLADEEIRKVVETAFKVKNGAQAFLKSAVAETAGQAPTETDDPCCASTAGGCC